MSKALFGEAHSRIHDKAVALRSQPMSQLRAFVHTPLKEQLKIRGRPIEIPTWAREHAEDRLAVIVEARIKRFFGLDSGHC